MFISIAIFACCLIVGGWIGADLPTMNVKPEDIAPGDGIGILLGGAVGLVVGGAVGLVVSVIYWRRTRSDDR